MIGKYWKAIIAFVGVLTTGVLTVAADPDIVAAIPAGWGAAVLAAGTVLTGVLAYLKRQIMTVDQIDTALKSGDLSVKDLKALIDRWNTIRP